MTTKHKSRDGKTDHEPTTPVNNIEGTVARLPQAPQTKSPVPSLTSIHAKDGRGQYGSAAFRGNCSGLLIRDILQYFRPAKVLDPMAGSGTCRDVCLELGISCQSFDLSEGADATDPATYHGLSDFDFVWLHPPYWKVIRYGNDPRCLSNAPTLDAFLFRLQTVLENCAAVLSSTGRMAVLMGDGKDEGEYLGLPFRTLEVAARAGLWLAAPEIVRFAHGTKSARKSYSKSFIPRLHDICLILKRRRTVLPIASVLPPSEHSVPSPSLDIRHPDSAFSPFAAAGFSPFSLTT